ncbi:hypothetical protein FOXG_21339 [Fusarium oxysporum f. sp. lycopersici 4287]|uniref:Uncharacterized protein n=2 Tax=Fusarium oxysporum f. sp. lycopersici (strain 4287 / CBS 123668 / FGSC 9935 / NRRL 34936) TaxID=426428 RepID=A0A0J9VWV2_FUSO4|nr:hypothetical protein FOXG_21339 [Fusarium oxysporum f. sp. lycopersici 4287]KNB15464.1 hypothetical protein FOXG_21339 [Fusarium oxysporum f. sp. lycopersici 4287]
MTDPLEDKVVETSPPILSPSTLLADAQQLQEERLFRHFRGWLFSERAKDTSSWTWDYGYDIQRAHERRWVCKLCIHQRVPQPKNFTHTGLQNASKHLFKEHHIRAPEGKTKSSTQLKAESVEKQHRSIADTLTLDPEKPREQAMANSFVKNFDRDHFQRMVMQWIVKSNLSFLTVEDEDLRAIFDYLSPSVSIRGGHLSADTLRTRIITRDGFNTTLRASSTMPRTSGRPADHQVHREFITISSDASSGFKNSRVKCKHCGHETAKGTTRQKKHLLRHCPNYRGQQQSEQSQLTQHFPVVDKTFKQMLDELAARAIFADGRPFNLFESKRMRILLNKLNTAWQPPSRRRVQRLLAPTYSEYRNQVQDILDQTERINVIFDGSDNITSHRIINISIQVANGLAFYWKTFDTGQIQHTAEHYIDLLYPELEIICKDTDSVMRKAHVHLAARKEFQHCFFSLCDSHGLQLLIKDILEQPFFEEAFKSATLIVTFFKKSKLQLARLREAQKAAWGHHKAFLSAAITRWGSQFNALWSVLHCKEPLQTYARRPDVRAELASGSLELLPRVLESVNNPHFWIRLETVLAIIKPVSSRQHASEADRAHIGHVIPRWLEIKAEWKALDDSQQHKDVNFSELYSVWLNRMDKQTYDIHYAGFALRPDTVGTKLEEQLMMKVLQFFKSAVNPADHLHIVREFNHFRAQSGGQFAAGGLVYSKEWTPLDAWMLLDNQGSKLAALAVRIFGTIANSVPSERSFSAVNFLHSKARNRLTPANADKLAFIYMNERVLERITQSQNQPLGHRDEVDSTVVSWEDLTEDGWLTLEDTYMEIHCASSLEVDAVIGEFTHQPASDGEETIVEKFEVQDGSESEGTGGN